MEFKATLKYLRIAPRKVRLVVDGIQKYRRLAEAVAVLEAINKRAAKPFRKLLLSAAANAQNIAKVPLEALKIKSITVNEGPRVKRARLRERLRMSPYFRRTTHLSVVLESETDYAPIEGSVVPKKEGKYQLAPKSGLKRPYKGRLVDEKVQKGRTKAEVAKEILTRKVIP